MLHKMQWALVISICWIIYNSNIAWFNLQLYGSEFFLRSEERTVHIYVAFHSEYSEGLSYEKCSLKIFHKLPDNMHRLWSVRLVRGFSDSSDIVYHEHFLQGRVSPDLQYYVLQFVGGAFVICRLTEQSHSEPLLGNVLEVLFHSRQYSSLPLTIHYADAHICTIYAGDGRVVFRCNAAENSIERLVEPDSICSLQ